MTETTAPVAAHPGGEEADRHEPGALFRELSAAYRAKTGEELPLGAYAALVGLYTAGMIGALEAVEHRDCSELSHISPKDFILLALATHKLSRLITKDYVTSPLRAPVAQYEEATGAGEVRETPRGKGMQKALGELFT